MNSLLFILLQINVTEDLSNPALTGELKLSFWEMALKGGWIMIPIVLLSIVAIYIFFERYFAIKKAYNRY